MSLLRIRCSLAEAPDTCHWVLLDNGRDPVAGEGPLAELPRGARRIQLVIPSDQVLITHARLPHSARRHSGSVLAYAVENEILGDPDANQVSWLGMAGDNDVLAVVDRTGLKRWQDALDGVGIRGYEVHCESLLLPWTPGTWSLAWNGTEGFARTGEFDGVATDCGDYRTPPLSLRLLLQEAAAGNARPDVISIYETVADSAPECAAWSRELGVDVRRAGTWDWRTAAPEAGVRLAGEHRPWGNLAGTVARLRPAAWITGAALAFHAVALVMDWTLLAHEQRTLRGQMDARFRSVFPEAVAVVDPVLQMRRKLAEARHAAGRTDDGDFLPMIRLVAAATEIPADAVRAVSYESGRMTLELAAVDAASLEAITRHLRRSGLSVESPPAPARTGAETVVLVVRAS